MKIHVNVVTNDYSCSNYENLSEKAQNEFTFSFRCAFLDFVRIVYKEIIKYKIFPCVSTV